MVVAVLLFASFSNNHPAELGVKFTPSLIRPEPGACLFLKLSLSFLFCLMVWMVYGSFVCLLFVYHHLLSQEFRVAGWYCRKWVTSSETFLLVRIMKKQAKRFWDMKWSSGWPDEKVSLLFLKVICYDRRHDFNVLFHNVTYSLSICWRPQVCQSLKNRSGNALICVLCCGEIVLCHC